MLGSSPLADAAACWGALKPGGGGRPLAIRGVSWLLPAEGAGKEKREGAALPCPACPGSVQMEGASSPVDAACRCCSMSARSALHMLVR